MTCEIAQAADMQTIDKVAAKLGIDSDYVENYGKYKAKIALELYERVAVNPDGKLILISAITPGFAVMVTGDLMTMPGLPKVPGCREY